LNVGRIVEYLRTASANPNLAIAGFSGGLPMAQHIPTYLAALVSYYFSRMILPFPLSPDPDVALVAWTSFSLTCALLAIGAMCFAVWKTKDELLRYGILALLISPLSLHVFAPATDIVLEHRAYIAGLGIALLSMWALRNILRNNFERKFELAAVTTIVLALSVITFQHNTIYASPLSYWSEAARQSPNKARPHLNLGAAWYAQGQFREAEKEYRQAIALKPNLWAARSNLASAYAEEHRYKEAEAELVQVVNGAPAFSVGWINLGAVYISEGKLQPERTADGYALRKDSVLSLSRNSERQFQ
jgi:tetratricopeptide (TPR) repeat protein